MLYGKTHSAYADCAKLLSGPTLSISPLSPQVVTSKFVDSRPNTWTPGQPTMSSQKNYARTFPDIGFALQGRVVGGIVFGPTLLPPPDIRGLVDIKLETSSLRSSYNELPSAIGR